MMSFSKFLIWLDSSMLVVERELVELLSLKLSFESFEIIELLFSEFELMLWIEEFMLRKSSLLEEIF